ncbi:nitrate reductase, alpha subunit [compost metagenome]
MIGGYAQQAWGFNYYGTVGCNRDEFVVVRKMAKVDWLDGTDVGGLGGDALPQPLPTEIE